MGNVRRCDCALQLETVQVGDAFEQSLAGAKKEWRDAQIHSVDETGLEVLVGDAGTAGQADILCTRCSLRLLERRLDSIGNEVEGVVTLQPQWLARMMREHENWMVI